MCYKFYKHYNFQTIITFKKGPLIFLNRRSFLYASMFFALLCILYVCMYYLLWQLLQCISRWLHIILWTSQIHEIAFYTNQRPHWQGVARWPVHLHHRIAR